MDEKGSEAGRVGGVGPATNSTPALILGPSGRRVKEKKMVRPQSAGNGAFRHSADGKKAKAHYFYAGIHNFADKKLE